MMLAYGEANCLPQKKGTRDKNPKDCNTGIPTAGTVKIIGLKFYAKMILKESHDRDRSDRQLILGKSGLLLLKTGNS